jgi:hypothetical protein
MLIRLHGHGGKGGVLGGGGGGTIVKKEWEKNGIKVASTCTPCLIFCSCSPLSGCKIV